MLKFITNIQISRRLLFAFFLAAVIPGIIISILGFTFINSQRVRGQAVARNINAFKTTTTAGSYLPRLIELLKITYQNQYDSKQAASTQSTVSQLRTVENLFDQTIRQYKQNDEINSSTQMRTTRAILLADDPHTRLPAQQQDTLVGIQNTLWPDYRQAQNKVLAALARKEATKEQIAALLQQASDRYAVLKTQWDRVTTIAEQVSDRVAEIGAAQINTMLLATVIAFLSAIIIVTAIGYIVYLTITRPLHQLALLTRRIAKGETSARAFISGNDEIYLVANSMNTMLDNIVHLIQETQSQRDALQAQVEKLVSEVSGVGEGDLRIQAEVTGDALGVLADSFNYMIEELGSLVVRVKLVASEVGRTTSAVLDRMTQLVETGNRQITQIAEASSEIEQMSAASRQVAERAQFLHDIARVARHDAQVGRAALQQAIAGMGRINGNVQTTASKVQDLGERSREINEIVEVISGIAHQTNRLALDAAIQAAMAGEHGKGFGAVAADIRRLAGRTKDQASIIGRIVRGVSEDIGAVAASMEDTQRETIGDTHLTQEAGIALESIFAAVEHQAREIEHINRGAIQQLHSSSTVVEIMYGVSESTQQSSANTQDASQQMERLALLVEQLRASVEAFKLRENQGYTIPNTGTTIPTEEEPESPLTVSGVFRTVSTISRPLRLSAFAAGSPSVVPLTANTPMPETRERNFVYYNSHANQRSHGGWD